MSLGSGIRCVHTPRVSDRHRRSPPGAKKGNIMELLILAIVVLVAFGLYRFMRARTAH
jgi:hypothetical protein